ncbi:large ribosomal subunit protein mL55 [Dipodomys merriami]|uniref:large ribosomal subunit protein mL55 n=1 Tax=Dipodomys merriami TaxID=94247 RepID=UPI0038558DDE
MVAGRSTLEKAIPPGLRRGEAREEGTRHSGEPQAGRIRRQSGERSPAELHSGRPGRRHRGPPLPEAGFFGPRTRVVRRWLKPAACTQPGRCSPRAAPRVTSRSAPQSRVLARPGARAVVSRAPSGGTGAEPALVTPRDRTGRDATARERAAGSRPSLEGELSRQAVPRWHTCPVRPAVADLWAAEPTRSAPGGCAELGAQAEPARRLARKSSRTPPVRADCPGSGVKKRQLRSSFPVSEQTFTERLPHHGPWGTDEEKEFLRLLWQRTVKSASSVPCFLHTSSRQADSNRASVTRLRRQAYARLYPVLLVKQDGSTIHIRYREPRRMLVMPLDLDTLTPEERRARFRKREALLQQKKEEEPELVDGFDTEQYRQFWSKTRK